MTLPDSFKYSVGTGIILADVTDHSPAAVNNIGTRTDQIDCTDLVAGAARQSDKFDFLANWDIEFALAAVIEWETTPEIAAGEAVDFYIGFSNSATDANANPAGLSGSDAAYAGYAAGGLAASLQQLTLIGSMPMDNVINTDQAQIKMDIGFFTPTHRHGILVVVNSAVAAAFHDDMIETSFLIAPRVLQIVD